MHTRVKGESSVSNYCWHTTFLKILLFFPGKSRRMKIKDRACNGWAPCRNSSFSPKSRPWGSGHLFRAKLNKCFQQRMCNIVSYSGHQMNNKKKSKIQFSKLIMLCLHRTTQSWQRCSFLSKTLKGCSWSGISVLTCISSMRNTIDEQNIQTPIYT